MFNLKGKVSIVTGSTSGIGKATAEYLARQGATVVVSGRREAEGQHVVQSIAERGGTATFVRADVTVPEDVAQLFERTKSQFGRIDIVFLNSGVYRFAPLEEQTLSDLGSQIEVNIKGVYSGLQQVAKHLGEGSSVVINTSVVADVGMPGTTAYSLTKGAMNTLVRTAAVELAQKGIRVNAVSPGPIWTEGLEAMTGSRDNAEANLAGLTVMNRVGDPGDIAAGVVFLASDEAKFITGHILAIDGGVTIK